PHRGAERSGPILRRGAGVLGDVARAHREGEPDPLPDGGPRGGGSAARRPGLRRLRARVGEAARAPRGRCRAAGEGAAVIRALTAADFDAVVALDARISGVQRRSYFERRLRAALRQPRRHLQLAADDLAGFVLARKAGGEYGDPENA